jgi:hypothetical protein
MWRRVDLVWTDISEERIASIVRVEKSTSEEPAWAGGCRLHSFIENYMFNVSYIVACILCLVDVFTEPFPRIEWRDKLYRALALQRWEEYIYRHIYWWEGFMKYVAEMGSGAMI